jgi:hypothetical protein
VIHESADWAGRKTEEGFLIYKEAELDIDPEAGGTPLCPFDCECCKSRRGLLVPSVWGSLQDIC